MIAKNKLRELYHEKDMTQAEIAEQHGVTKSCVSQWMKRQEIDTNYSIPSEEKLKEMYHEQDMSQKEIADELDSSQGSVSHWFDKHGINQKSKTDLTKEKLQRLYHDNEMSKQDIADRSNCTKRNVQYLMDKHGISSRSLSESISLAKGHPSLSIRHGYETFYTSDTEFRHHRLLAVAKHGLEALEGMVVHHKNEVKWDNRPENLELMTASEHAKHHHNQTSLIDDLFIQELYRNENKTMKEIAPLFDMEYPSIQKRIRGEMV